MSNVVELVEQITILVSRFGISNIENALEFIKKLEDNVTYRLHNPVTGGIHNLTQNQHDMLVATYANGYGKISAIKLLSKYTGCGLRDAKEMVEKYLQNT